jgi:predicted aldo/keto reductase-like oxidoreductase
LLYRELGNTGLKVSRIGFGAMRLPMAGAGAGAVVDLDKALPLIHHAFELGVNYIDTAIFYCNNDSQRAVGAAIKGRRDRIIVSAKNDHKGTDEALWHKKLNDSLRLMDIDYIDVYNIHGLSWREWQEAGEPAISKWLTRARDQGLVRHICASCHDKPENMIKLIDTGFFEAFTVQYNLLDRSYAPAIEHARQKGVGIVVMGPLAGRRVVDSGEAFGAVNAGRDNISELGLRFVLSNPGVTMAISGMKSIAEIEQNVRVASDEAALSPQDRSAIDAHCDKLKAAANLYCTGCEYCMPCPQNVRIPRIFAVYNLARVYKSWPAARADYQGIAPNTWDPQAQLATACNDCGACEKKCPQKIQIRRQLKEAHQALSPENEPG